LNKYLKRIKKLTSKDKEFYRNKDNFRVNPYDFVNPVKDLKFFFGRKKELEEIEYYLKLALSDNPKYFHLALIGKRSVGKTSLLNIIKLKSQEFGMLTAKIPLDLKIADNDVLFFKELIDNLITNAVKKGLYGGIKGRFYKKFRSFFDNLNLEVKIPLLFSISYKTFKQNKDIDLPYTTLIEDLNKIYKKIRKKFKNIIIFIDECDLLANNQIILQKIRNIFAELNGYILVLVGTDILYPSLEKTFSPFPRFFKRINLNNFTSVDETKECLINPLSIDEKKKFNFNCIRDIHNITNGSPYEINLMAHYMYRRWKEKNSPTISLSLEVLDDILNDLERFQSKKHYETIKKINNLGNDLLKVLLSLLEFPNVSKTFLSNYILLDYINIIDKDNIESISSQISENIDIIKKDKLISSRKTINFNLDDFEILYLKYNCIAKGFKDLNKTFVGFPNEPIFNIEKKIIENIILSNFEQYFINTHFDGIENISGHRGHKCTIGTRVNIPPGEHKILLFSPEIADEFYLEPPNSVRFRINIQWMNEGFVSQIKLNNPESLDRLMDNLNSLKDKLSLIGCKIILKDEVIWNREGIELEKKGNLEEALICYNKAIELNNSFETALINKASLLYRLKMYKEGLKFLDKVLEFYPNSLNALMLKGNILIRCGKSEEAIEQLNKSLRLDPKNWNILNNLGRAYSNLKNYTKAEKYYNQSLELNPNEPHVLNNYALLLFTKRENSNLAEEFFSKSISIDPNNAIHLNNYANFLRDVRNDYEKAESHYKKALKRSPNNLKINYDYIRFLVNNKKELEKAEIIFNNLIQIYPNNAILYNNYANYLMRFKKNYEKAELYFKKALKNDRHNAIIYFDYGFFLSSIKNDFKKADEFLINSLQINSKIITEKYKEQIRLNPHLVQPKIQLGSLYETLQDYDNALKVFSEAEKIEPDNPDIILYKGIILLKLKELKNADLYLKKALSLVKGDKISEIEANIHYNLACLYSLKGLINDVLLELGIAINFDNGYKDLAERDTDFDNVRKNIKFRKLIED